MKKMLVLFALAVLVLLAGCDSDGGGRDGDVNGAWTNADNTVKLELGSSSWTFIKAPDSTTGEWSRNENILTFRDEQYGAYGDFASGTLTEGKLVLNVKRSAYKGLYELSRSGSPTAKPETGSLTVKNESFAEIADVLWQNVSFANSVLGNSIRTGTSVTRGVPDGSGYIFFRRSQGSAILRTKDQIVVEKNGAVEFTFTDNTLVVDISNPQNSGTLGTIQ